MKNIFKKILFVAIFAVLFSIAANITNAEAVADTSYIIVKLLKPDYVESIARGSVAIIDPNDPVINRVDRLSVMEKYAYEDTKETLILFRCGHSVPYVNSRHKIGRDTKQIRIYGCDKDKGGYYVDYPCQLVAVVGYEPELSEFICPSCFYEEGKLCFCGN